MFDQPDKNADFVLFFEPPSLDERIVNQVALFSFTSRADLQMDDWLDTQSNASIHVSARRSSSQPS